jgi:2-polyprenyl-6-methoxyphenol hydroxylase-like FAD-dependent oxidoreductase
MDVGVTNIGGTLPASTENTEQLKKLHSIVSFTRLYGQHRHSMLLFSYRNYGQSQKEMLWSLSWPTESTDRYVDPPKDKQEREHHMQELKNRLLEHVRYGCREPEVHRLVELTPPESLLSLRPARTLDSSVSHKNVRIESKFGRVTLLGDAAHPMTTHRGLGANTALLDARDLARALTSIDWRKSTQSYERVLFKRGFANAAASLQSTRMIHLDGWKASLRNGMMWFVGCLISAYSAIRTMFSRQ